MERTRRARRYIASVVLPSFLWLVSGAAAQVEAHAAQDNPGAYLLEKLDDPRLPLSAQARERLKAAATDLAAHRARRAAAQPPAAEAQAVQELQQAADELLRADPALKSHSPRSIKAGTDAIAAIRGRLTGLHRQVLKSLMDAEASMSLHGVETRVRERARSLRRAFDDSMRAVLGDLQIAESLAGTDDGPAALTRAVERLQTNSTARPESLLDPARLPFRPPDAKVRAPRLTNDEFKPPASRSSEQTRGATAQAARAAVKSDELAETEDAQITPAVQALAASLDNDPLKIYTWVRNNIEFVPTYGSVQGSAMTLLSRRGNAFDISSLLIALLRSAGVGARYVLGTVEVPGEAVMNWTGGTETPEVAQQLLGQGGIPNVGLLRGSTLTHIRMEHVWVEAFVNYVPGRGAAQRAGDTWVPLDASFKLHTFTPPSQLSVDVPFDLAALSNQVLASGEFDPLTERIANVDQDLLFPFWTAWQDQAQSYLAAKGIADTPDGVLGGQATSQKTSTVFAGSLPYTVVARGPGQTVLPAEVRHYVTVRGFASPFDRILGSASFSYRVSLPQLNSRRLGLTFAPATAADAAIVDQARSSNAASLPAHLIHVVPVLTLDGATVATGASAPMGSTQPVDVTLEGPGGSTTISYDAVLAGDEIVFGITGNGVNQEVVQARFNTFPPDNAAEYLHQVQLHYWMESDYFGALTARALGVHTVRLPSVGLFASPLTVGYLFGVPVSAVYQSRIMDVKQSLIGAAGSDVRKVVAFFVQAGYQGSFMEGAAFDQFEDQPIRTSISAVQLIADALAVGIPVYHVTPANAATVLPRLSLSAAVESDIANAIAAGRTVLVPERNLDRGPWSGVGYIVQDEATGAGAYLISGGVSGGGLIECLPDLVPILVIILAFILLAILLFLLAPELAPALVPALAGAAAAGPVVAASATTAVPRTVYLLALIEAMYLSTSRVPSTAP
jgi:transglutaminase-like putative cysteine protease